MSATLQIALVQSPLFWEDPKRNRAFFGQKLDALTGRCDLIILPEMFTTGFTMTPHHIDREEGERTVEWMREAAFKTGAALMGSTVFNESGKYYNRLIFAGPEGRLSHYDKRHTFSLAGEDKVYTAGRDRLLVELKGFRICPMICYDLRFPVWCRNTQDYDLLIFVANWPAARIRAWDVLLKARAIENMAYCAGVNRTGSDDTGHGYPGHSAVYDCLGEALVYSREDGTHVAALNKAHIDDTRARLRFLQDRDDFNLRG